MLQVIWIKWWYFAQFPTFKIQIKDVFRSLKIPALCMIDISEMPHYFNIMALWPHWLNTTSLDPTSSQGWNSLKCFPGQQSAPRQVLPDWIFEQLYLYESCFSCQFFNDSWWWTHCKLCLYAPLLLQEALASCFFHFRALLQGWDGWDWETRRPEGNTFLPFRSVKEKK